MSQSETSNTLKQGMEQLAGLKEFKFLSSEFSEEEKTVWVTISYTSIHGEPTRQVSAMIMGENVVLSIGFYRAEDSAGASERQYRELMSTFRLL
jgi:hypothetical protein